MPCPPITAVAIGSSAGRKATPGNACGSGLRESQREQCSAALKAVSTLSGGLEKDMQHSPCLPLKRSDALRTQDLSSLSDAYGGNNSRESGLALAGFELKINRSRAEILAKYAACAEMAPSIKAGHSTTAATRH